MILCFNPRAPGGARWPCLSVPTWQGFIVSIHAPPEGRDLHSHFIEFQSTRPRRGAIRHGCMQIQTVSIHAPPEGRDYGMSGMFAVVAGPDVSIHAPPEGRDDCVHSCTHSPIVTGFNPRAPGGARCYLNWNVPDGSYQGFNPRAPGGARCIWQFCHFVVLIARFQSTRPRRGAIYEPRYMTAPWKSVSIHAPPEGRDSLEKILGVQAYQHLFQSTRPRRGAMTFDERCPVCY